MAVRTLKLTSPAMHGNDVSAFQRDLNAELKRWQVPHVLNVDGVYGTETRDVARSVAYGLGLKTPVLEHGATPAVRSKVRHRKLTPMELVRFKERAEWRNRLEMRYGAPSKAVMAALTYARAHVGVTEHPAGSNRGPQVDEWERECGVLGAPWCGCFANAVLVAGGFPSDERLRYCPWIEGMAKSGEGGWSWHSTPMVGDLVLYGASIAQHVGFVASFNTNGNETIEGNTSNGPGGSQSNGGIVAVRHRGTDGSLNGFPIRGYARPPWKAMA